MTNTENHGSLQTLNDVFSIISGRGQQTVMLWQDSGGAWLPITADELRRRVIAFTTALKAWGMDRGDRLAILAENRWEWAVTDFAALALGVVDVPLYPTLTAEQVAYALNDSGARMLVVSSKAQYEKVKGIVPQTKVECVLVMDAGAEGGALGAKTFGFGEFLARGEGEPDIAAFNDLLKKAWPEDLATIIYTSGTTGESKGVMLTHGNIAANLNYSTREFDFTGDDVSISFLPLSHITARHLDYALLYRGCVLAYCPDFAKLLPAMAQVNPTVFVAVPRVYEKVRQAVEQKSAASPVRSRILAWALKTGKAHRVETLRGETPRGFGWKVAQKLVFTKIRAAFGGRVRLFVSGGAPLGMNTAGWLADVGIRVHEGYGLTETSPVIALNTPLHHSIGTVGRPLGNVECRIAPDGELEVRGPSIFQGYWQKPQQTRESFTEDGWFCTGDIGSFDAQGFLSITDRKKELLKTSGGKLIAPQPIENKLKSDLLVAQAALVGDKHKFASALLSPNFAALAEWAARQNLACDVSTEAGRAALVQTAEVHQAYAAIVSKVNSTLAPFESIKRFKIVPQEWTLESGELTPSLKLKRRVIVQRYEPEISAFYADEAVAHSK
ncbi:MAG: long-chain fatty acid--CoA ligase [Acidobacteriaceae bacterium]|nr:long-chain fatty acid--CoA ligase [Acidobacteriaceae bacterium]